jgi:hypothetical protein
MAPGRRNQIQVLRESKWAAICATVVIGSTLLAFPPAAFAQTDSSEVSEIVGGLWKDTVDGKQRELTSFAPRSSANNFGGMVANWTARDSTQGASRVSFNVPELTLEPSVTVSKLTTKDSPVKTGAIRVERSASLKSGSLNLLQDFIVADIDGHSYRRQKVFSIDKGSSSARAELDDHDFRSLTIHSAQGDGILHLPNNIEGEILGFEVDPQTARLVVETTKGISYTFAIKNKDGALSFTPTGKQPVAGGLKSFAAKVENFDCSSDAASVDSATEQRNLHDSTTVK